MLNTTQWTQPAIPPLEIDRSHNILHISSLFVYLLTKWRTPKLVALQLFVTVQGHQLQVGQHSYMPELHKPLLSVQ